MKRIEQWRATFEYALEKIECYRASDNESTRLIANWLMSMNSNPYSIFQPGYARGFDTAEGFAGLMQVIHHALVDDGEITFVAVNGRPMIAFAAPNELHRVDLLGGAECLLQKKNGKKPTYEIIDGVPEFIARRERYEVENADRIRRFERIRNQEFTR